MRQSPATSRCAHWLHGSAWNHSSCSLLEQVLVITHRRSCAILIHNIKKEGFHMDWILSAFQPLTAASVVLPAGANMDVTVSMEPESKEAIIIQAIQEAKSSIWAEMYTFTDANVAGALDKAAQAHIDVRVLYEPRLSQTALQNLSPDRQHFPVWAHPNQAALPNQQPVNTRHAKFMVIDGNSAGQAKAYVMTANFTEQALGGDPLSTTVN